MVCHSVEMTKVKYINELLEDNQKITVKMVRLIDVVPWLTEQAIVCFTHSSEEVLAITAFSSLNTLLWTF